MKKVLFLSFAIIGFAVTQVAAQTPPVNGKYYTTVQTVDTAKNADTINVNLFDVGSKLKSIEFVFERLTGAIPTAGYALIQKSNDGRTWFDCGTDTLKFTDQLLNSKLLEFTSTTTAHYRATFRCPSGTYTAVGRIVYCRRPDE